MDDTRELTLHDINWPHPIPQLQLENLIRVDSLQTIYNRSAVKK